MSTHTPTPWVHRKAIHDAPNHIVAVLFDDQGRRITHFIGECQSAAVDNEANAAFIVEACNNYDRLANLEKINAALLEAMERIAKWGGEFPPSGRFWDDGTEMSYSAAYGSNGERNYMRALAFEAIALAKQGDIDPVSGLPFNKD